MKKNLRFLILFMFIATSNLQAAFSEYLLNKMTSDFTLNTNIIIQNTFDNLDFYTRTISSLSTNQNLQHAISDEVSLILPLGSRVVYFFKGTINTEKSNFVYNFYPTASPFIYETNIKKINNYQIQNSVQFFLSKNSLIHIQYKYEFSSLTRDYAENNFSYNFALKENIKSHNIKLRYQKKKFAGYLDGQQFLIKDSYTTTLTSTNTFTVDTLGVGGQYFSESVKSIFFIEPYINFSFLQNSMAFNVYNSDFLLKIPNFSASLNFLFLKNLSFIASQINDRFVFEASQSYNNTANAWNPVREYKNSLQFIPYIRYKNFSFYLVNEIWTVYDGANLHFNFNLSPGLIWENQHFTLETKLSPKLQLNFGSDKIFVQFGGISIFMKSVL